MATGNTQSSMTIEQYLEQNQGIEVAPTLEVSHRRKIHFMKITDKYRALKISIRDGYVDPDEPGTEAVGKGLDVPLKDFSVFVQRMNDIHRSLQEQGLVSK